MSTWGLNAVGEGSPAVEEDSLVERLVVVGSPAALVAAVEDSLEAFQVAVGDILVEGHQVVVGGNLEVRLVAVEGSLAVVEADNLVEAVVVVEDSLAVAHLSDRHWEGSPVVGVAEAVVEDSPVAGNLVEAVAEVGRPVELAVGGNQVAESSIVVVEGKDIEVVGVVEEDRPAIASSAVA